LKSKLIYDLRNISISSRFDLQTNIFIEPIVNSENISVKCDGLREKNI